MPLDTGPERTLRQTLSTRNLAPRVPVGAYSGLVRQTVGRPLARLIRWPDRNFKCTIIACLLAHE
jgi:hypothetical protein